MPPERKGVSHKATQSNLTENAAQAGGPIHPGEHLAEMLHELGVTPSRLAETIGAPPMRVRDIINGRRSIAADSALRIGRAFGTTPEYWLNLQRMHDLEV